MRKRALIYAIAFIVLAGLGIGLRFVNWEGTGTPMLQPAAAVRHAPAKHRPDPYDPTRDLARIDASPGPLYVFAHHHATYYAIKKLQLEGKIPARGNVLINFDCHDDANVPIAVPNPEDRDRATAFLKDPALPLAEKLKRLRAFVRDDLNITSWALALIDDGSLSAYYYVLPRRWPMEAGTQRAAVVNLERWGAGKPVVPGPKPPRVPKGFVLAVVRDDGLPSAEELAGKSVVVTFDLDYFSNLDNLMRVVPDEDYTPTLPTSGEISAAVASAVTSLKARHLQPRAILVAESPGFAPADQVGPIKGMLIPALQQAGLAR